MNFIVVIPARYASTRLPGKPLADIAGSPMIERTYLQAKGSQASRVVVATDHEEVFEVAQAFGAEVMMTSDQHQSGTDRLAEVAENLGLADEDILVNVQGDEPLIPPEVIDQVAINLANNADCACATLSEPVVTVEEFLNPAAVKVVTDSRGKALYFSRATVPFPRDAMPSLLSDQAAALPKDIPARRHIGIYAYRASLLRQFTGWPVADLEKIESLEQLRILSNGKAIHVENACAQVPGGVDTPEDLERVRSLLLQDA